MAGVAALAGGVAEGAALVALAATGKTVMEAARIRPYGYRRAGFLLACVFVLANLGGAAGAAITRTGDTGGLILAAACAALCPSGFLLAGEWRRRRSALALPEQSAGAFRQDDFPSVSWPGFTRREREVSALLIRDMTNSEICDALFVSENTVKTHIKNIYHKIGTGTRQELKKRYAERRMNGAW